MLEAELERETVPSVWVLRDACNVWVCVDVAIDEPFDRPSR